MFYAHFVLAKKGPLAKIWLAAHWDKKLTKAHVFETNIEKSVDGILKPKVKMALRTSGHLLLGVVRIYSRKAKYLLQDCNEAFVKIKMAFRPGMVDLPEEHREAAMNAITLPEVFHDFDTAMPELNEVDIEAQFSLNQSRAEEITMREDYGSLNLVTHDDGFGDMGFDTDNPDIMREAIGNEAGLEQSNLLFAEGSSLSLEGKPRSPAALDARRMEPAPAHHMDDAFPGPIADDGHFGHAGGLFEGDLFGEVSGAGGATPAAAHMPGDHPPQSLQAEIEAGVSSAAEGMVGGVGGGAEPQDSDDDMGDHYDAGNSPQHSWCESPVPETAAEPPAAAPPRPPSVTPMETEPAGDAGAAAVEDNTTLLHNDEESFALAPVDATVLKGITKTKRKRKLIVDEVKNISGEEMKNQLSNTSDIVTTLDLAPPTRRLMHWKETGGVEKLFTLPARQIPSRVLFKKYQRHMTLRSDEEEARSPRAEPHDPPRRTRKRRLEDHSAQQAAPAPEPAPPTPHYQPAEDRPEAPPSPREEDRPVTPPPVAAGGATPAIHSDIGPLTPAPLHDSLGVGGMTPGLSIDPSMTPGTMHAPMTPGGLDHGGMTPAGLQHGGMTPAGLQHGGMTPGGLQHGFTPAGLQHGGLTPAGLQHGGLTPAGLQHGGMTPAGLHHGGMTPAGLQHGGMTPVGLSHGGMTPAGLQHGGMTPAGLQHGGMTPGGLQHGGMTPAGLQHGGMTPTGLHHGGMTPVGLQHGQHPALLHASEQSPLLGAVQLQPPTHTYTDNLQNMTNLGYDDHHGHHSPQHDYDLPQTPENCEDGSREADETEAQFEERVLNRRAAQLFHALKPRLAQRLAINFIELAPPHNNRKQVAQKFYSLLVLKKHQVLKLEQNETYGPIIIHKGEQFETDAI